MDTTTLTISEYAKAIGISRQAAYKRLKDGKLNGYIITSTDGKTRIDGRILAAAEAPTAPKQATTTDARTAGQERQGMTIDFLVHQIDLKDAQIAALQQTVNDLSAALKLSQATVQASQTLNAAALNILPAQAPTAPKSETASSEADEKTPPERKSVWQRLFG